MPTTVNAVHSRATASEATRWGQLLFGIICMVMIANLQYGWTLFVNPIDQKYHWGRAAIQVAFTIFVLTETWLVPFEGYLIDKFGPRVMIGGSGVLVAIAWAIYSIADSLFLLYVGAAIGGIGAGVIYGGSVGNALKWFPDRRGLAAGLTADPEQRIPVCVPQVRTRSRYCRRSCCVVFERAQTGRSERSCCAGSGTDQA
jgi:OFA family oxalate/formate antiporter-like MFS transporter